MFACDPLCDRADVSILVSVRRTGRTANRPLSVYMCRGTRVFFFLFCIVRQTPITNSNRIVCIQLYIILKTHRDGQLCFKLIDECRRNEVLWDPNNPSYHSENLKHDARVLDFNNFKQRYRKRKKENIQFISPRNGKKIK